MTNRLVDLQGRRKTIWENGREVGTRSVADGASNWFRFLFLPQGYPDSVTGDYTEYQVWDTFQALFSGITGTLATRAVFVGVGVGEATATSGAATLNWLTKDGLGMIGRIVFASVQSTQLDSDAKRWRLVADITNDFGIFLEIASGFVDKSLFLPMVCTASISKAICGVCGGATRAALTQHFAKSNNMADVSAKDGNQETAVSLIGIVIGTIVAMLPDTAALTWTLFVLFTALHLFANYRGVSAVILRDINRQRLEICLREGFHLTPEQVSKREGIIFYKTANIIMGSSLESVFKSVSEAEKRADYLHIQQQISRGKPAIIRRAGTVFVVLPTGVSNDDLVLSYCEAYFLGLAVDSPSARVAALDPVANLKKNGWDLDRVLLNTHDHRVEC
eukprot:TRINITY_DN34072_c0_g1_i1.p1 TRINITY_DN34072_c0_g1~~TRINITY_DN34072_c0_g1_i1.p1  ORF type:complete len:391 (+),score=44.75 TRINITY_DN34072_c0_g1_i1:36-1208(+)